jgi:hypothetical protein
MNLDPRFAQSIEAHDPVEFFTGTVEAHGFVTDFRNRVRRRFVAQFNGTRKGTAVEVFETLTYADGGQDIRTWRIAPRGPNQWTADANDLVETAILSRGEHGGECRWVYRMDIPINGKPMRLNFEDIMVQLSPEHMVSLTPIRKFGIQVGAISTQYRRLG